MTQRERFLAIGVGGLLVLVALNWLFGKYRTAVNTRNDQIIALQTDLNTLQQTQVQGELARQQLMEYQKRSLPGNKEVAKGVYQQWLLGIANRKAKLRDPNLTYVNSASFDNLYQQLTFRLEGFAEFPQVIDLLHAFYAKDYMHRIRTLDIAPVRNREGYRVEILVDVAAINNVPEDAADPGEQSWRVDTDLAAYREPILNRNFFEPPNQAPQYSGSTDLEAILGRRSPISLTFKDPENKRMTYTLVGEVPEGISLDDRSGTLFVESDEQSKLEVTVMAKDPGYPSQSTEQKLVINVVEPPPKEEEPPAPPAFDDASQTVLTALIQGGDEWTAWLRVLTRDQIVKVRVGDEFEIGTIKAKVIDVNDRFAEFECEDRRFTVKSGGNLGTAAKSSMVD